MIGKKYSRLIVLKRAGTDKHGNREWLCGCECGNETIVTTGSLNSENTKSCGCLARETAQNKHGANLLGKRFGRLTVIERLSNNQYRERRWRSVCDCGGYATSTSSSLKSGQSKSCGCYQREVAKKLGRKNVGENNPMYGTVGEKSPNWKPELTEEDRLARRSDPEYNKWRTSVFERDGYTCQICGNDTGGMLNAHHLNGYNWDVKNRHNIKNGITLCVDCHSDFHKVYGKGDNTKEQFKEYLKEHPEALMSMRY